MELTMSKLWIISDTHFWHWNIGRLCNRCAHWQSSIIHEWNKRISPDDHVLHLGDFAYGRQSTLNKVKLTRTMLNGHIHLFRGNHDGKVASRKQWLNIIKVDNYIEKHLEYLELGQYIIVYLLREEHNGDFKKKDPNFYNKKIIYVSHRPIMGQVRMPYYYGHVHNNHDDKGCLGKNVCVEMNKYTPVFLDTIKP